MRINIEVDNDKWRNMGILAAVKGVSKRDILNDAVNDYLLKHDEYLREILKKREVKK